jgi:hypothetical protein
MTDMRLLFVCIAVLVLAASAGAANQAVHPVRATMTTTSTMPVADTPWRYTIVVEDRGGKPLPAKARLHILVGTRVVECWNGTAMTRCSQAESGTWIGFKGKRTGTLSWPARSAGSKRTFVATVVAGGRSLKLRAPVSVKLP